MTPTPAKNLQPGDIVLFNDYPVDILDIWRLPGPVIRVRFSVCDFDNVLMRPGDIVNVIGHFDG